MSLVTAVFMWLQWREMRLQITNSNALFERKEQPVIGPMSADAYIPDLETKGPAAISVVFTNVGEAPAFKVTYCTHYDFQDEWKARKADPLDYPDCLPSKSRGGSKRTRLRTIPYVMPGGTFVVSGNNADKLTTAGRAGIMNGSRKNHLNGWIRFEYRAVGDQVRAFLVPFCSEFVAGGKVAPCEEGNGPPQELKDERQP